MKRLFAGAFGCLLILGVGLWLYQSQTGKKTSQTTPQNGSSATGSITVGVVQSTSPVAAMPSATNGSTDRVRTGQNVASTGRQPAVASSPRKRAWDPKYLSTLSAAAEADPIRFELVN